MRNLSYFSAGLFLCIVATAVSATDVPVPARCTPEVNSRLAKLIQSETRHNVDNVMVCGITTKPSRSRKTGPHGGHHILSVRAELPGIGARIIEVATNDSLDGVVTAPAEATVFAYGQAYFDNTGQYVAGIHDVHCSTHRGADNGWIVVNGTKSPAAACR